MKTVSPITYAPSQLSTAVPPNSSKLEGRTVFHVDSSYLAKQDRKAGGVGPEMFRGLGKALTVAFIAWSTAIVTITAAIVSRSFATTAIAGGVTALVTTAASYAFGFMKD